MTTLANSRPAALAQRPKLMVVDDQAINVQVLYQAFAPDHQVIMATGGAQALQQCRAHLPDLVLLDVVMPGMDGYEVCRQLKADPATRAIPVIFVTAQDDASQEALGLALGAVDFIVKPVNVAVVRARVHTHLALARSAALLSATLEATADGILVTDLAGGIGGMNQNFLRMWGVPAELLGATRSAEIAAFMQSQLLDAPDGGHRLADAGQAANEPNRFDALALQGDRHFERHVRPLWINASLRGHVFSFSDVSERTRATNDLRLLTASLERRILERTRELELAVQQADAANRAKSNFLSNMSHEIRTPMNGVIGMAYLALRADPEPAQRRYLEKIHSAGQHLLGIINDILDFSKIEADRLDLEVLDFDVATVFDRVASQLADAAQAKGLRLAFEVDANLSRPLRGDALRIGQVLINFVGNAIKFTAEGEVLVRATTLQRGAGESRVRFEVRDSGIGLTRDQIGKLFAPFQQADTSTTRQYGGTGLGLAICKRLAALMGGEVGVDSVPGCGSTFWFSATFPWAVPLANRADDVAMNAASTGRARGATDALRGARILLVEDNLLNQEVATAMLEHAGALVRTADNGQQALDRLRDEPFDCVLMDMQMPVIDGLQATRAIRANPLTAATPVLAMTANARSEDRARCIDAGMNAFMTKPILPELLYATVARWLAPRAAPGPAGEAAAVAPVAPDSVPATTAAVAVAGSVASAVDANAVDLSILSRSVGGDLKKVRRYATLFVEQMPESIAELEAALASSDLPALADLGHRLKSSSKMVGAMGVAALCESLEGLRATGTVGQARAIVEKIPLVFAAASADINRAFA